ncbi:alpha/beta fold hydrolase [Paenibacillus nasutitermitis]|uniref:Sigma factor SigB regulation protein RsbQ n=1 Tax=Paenibacillus nasutitermitis TaxID=1652958 RepID=A0A916Z732_9BACL|nr:alpha/beta hydrolase [Paenibacillus nasutitermitis]GGD78191.1 sigma factor SigB regulation protein RsbQ [Paenibacillus nasutitermitis]
MNNIDVRNNVSVIGNGERTLVFAHGFGCDQSMWKYITPSFEEKYRIVLFDYVGSGHSDLKAYQTEKYDSLQGYVQDVLDIIETHELKNIIFIGHSISSMIGMLASIERPEYFDRLIMIGPSPCYLNTDDYHGGFDKSDITELLDMMEMNFAGWASFMAPLAMNNPELPQLSKELERSFISADPVIAREFAEVTFLSDHRKDLSQATVPTLILQCSDDSIVPLEAGEYLHRHLRNSTFQLMEAKGHYPHISHPGETIGFIQDYLQNKGQDETLLEGS